MVNNIKDVEKNKALNVDILKWVKQVVGMVMRVLSRSSRGDALLGFCRQRGQRMLMGMGK